MTAEAIGNFFLGKKCTKCEGLGVTCDQPGFLPSLVTGVGSVITVKETQIHTLESIDECSVVTGNKSQEEVVAKLKETAAKAKASVLLGSIGNN